MVQVKEGTNALAEFQMLTKVDSSAELCYCSDKTNDSDEKQLHMIVVQS